MTKLLMFIFFIFGFFYPAFFAVAAILIYTIYLDNKERVEQELVEENKLPDSFTVNIETDIDNILLKHITIIPTDGVKVNAIKHEHGSLKDNYIEVSNVAVDDSNNIFFDIQLLEEGVTLKNIKMIKESYFGKYKLEIYYHDQKSNRNGML